MTQSQTDPFAGLPGHPMMWVLVGSELLVFGGALVAFSAARIADPSGFQAAQDHLDRLAGLFNVMVLVTSGLFAALAVEATRRDASHVARRHLAIAGLLGLVFLAAKVVEYARHIEDGFTIESGTFFTLYYLITGFHALHVVLGIVILAIVGRWPTVANIESGAVFWHMVDLVWLLVFPILYLVR